MDLLGVGQAILMLWLNALSKLMHVNHLGILTQILTGAESEILVGYQVILLLLV